MDEVEVRLPSLATEWYLWSVVALAFEMDAEFEGRPTATAVGLRPAGWLCWA